MSLPVPGCRTTRYFRLSGWTGTWKKPSRMSYFAKCVSARMHGRTSHGDGSAKGAVATYWFVPTE